jgi:hypothetical protein
MREPADWVEVLGVSLIFSIYGLLPWNCVIAPWKRANPSRTLGHLEQEQAQSVPFLKKEEVDSFKLNIINFLYHLKEVFMGLKGVHCSRTN